MPFGFYYKYIAISFVFIIQLLNNIHPPTKIYTPFGRNKYPSQKFPPQKKSTHYSDGKKNKQTKIHRPFQIRALRKNIRLWGVCCCWWWDICCQSWRNSPSLGTPKVGIRWLIFDLVGVLAWVVVFFSGQKGTWKKGVFFNKECGDFLPIFHGESRRFVPCRDGGGFVEKPSFWRCLGGFGRSKWMPWMPRRRVVCREAQDLKHDRFAPKGSVLEGRSPKISGKSRLVKYYNLART